MNFKSISEEENNMLVSNFTKEEIKGVVWRKNENYVMDGHIYIG